MEGFRNPVWLPVPIEGSQRLEVERSLVDIEQRLVPATKEEILTLLTALAEYYGISKQEGLDTRFVMMVEDLRGYSLPHIHSAIAEHRRSCNWFPKSSELLPILLHRFSNAKAMRFRARILLGIDPPTSVQVDLLERLKSQREREASDKANTPSLEDRLKVLPAPLAESARRLIQAAKNTDERRSA